MTDKEFLAAWERISTAIHNKEPMTEEIFETLRELNEFTVARANAWCDYITAQVQERLAAKAERQRKPRKRESQ